MARRRIADEPIALTALWARRLALFAMVASVLSIIIVRSGLLEIRPALATFAGALAFAAAAIVLAFAAFVVIWRQGLDGLGSAILALCIGTALLAYPAYLGIQAYRLPPITDVVTDPDDPPASTSSRGYARAMPIRSPIPAARQPSSSVPLTPTSNRWSSLPTPSRPTTPRWR